MGRKKDPNKERRVIHLGLKEFEYTVELIHGKRKLHFSDKYGRYPNGRTRYIHLYATSEVELKQKINDYLQKIGTDSLASGNDIITIMMLCEEWLFHLNNDYNVKISRVTIDKHESIIRSHIIPFMGSDSVKNLEKKSYISKFFAYLSKSGNTKTHGPLSFTSLKHVYSTLSLLCQYAAETERKYIEEIGIKEFNLKKDKRKDNNSTQDEKKPYLSSDDISRLYNVCNRQKSDGSYKYHYRSLFLFILYTGLRTEEAIGLLKSSCHLDEKYINVNHTIIRYKKRDKNGKQLNSFAQELVPYTKNESSERVVYLSDEAIEILKYVFDSFPKSQFAFTNTKGDMISLNLLNKRFATLCKEAEIAITNPYILRHTFATRLVNNSNVKLEQVSKLMGHSNTATTYNNYVHQSKEEKDFISGQISAAMDILHDASAKKCNVDLYALSMYAKGKGVEIYELEDDEITKFLLE